MDTLNSLRKKHPTFLYENFSYQKENKDLVISFLFKILPDIEFAPEVKIENINDEILSQIDPLVLENFIFHLGLVEMLSYWKATCSPKIEIKAGSLNEQQKRWWEELLIKGLGEFFFQNKINFRKENFVTIENSVEKNFSKDTSSHQELYLLLNGGGRDSIVTIEALKELKKQCTIMMLNPSKASQEVLEISPIKDNIVVRREIDSKLLELNANGYLNGHTPFSAYLAFLSILCALILDHKYVVVSNERSANEENTEFLGAKINHQYSKSFEFEKSFREYVVKNLSENIEYFSLLRPLYELQISKIFSKYSKYFTAFKSCNRGQKKNEWCGKCPKCLSIYITLYPFVEAAQLAKIFQGDLYDKEELQDLLLHLIGEKHPKPFECVGTYEELKEGLRLSIKKLEENDKPLPFLLKIQNINPDQDSILKSWGELNFLPGDLEKNLKAKITNET